MDNWLSTYCDVLEGLQRDNLETLVKVTAREINFRDPFNHTSTQSAFISVMADMYERLPYVDFSINHRLQLGHKAYINWIFSSESRYTGPFHFEGVTRIEANQSGLVVLHHDFWDASELMQKFPLIGGVIGRLRSKLGH